MKAIFNHKLFEILFEKALIALVLLFAGYLANQSIERYKLIEVQRAAGVSAFVSACHEIWSKLHAYEDAVDDAISARTKRWLPSGEKNLKNKQIEVESRDALLERQLTDLKVLISEREFVIGQRFVVHFFRYVGFVKARADAKITANEKQGYEAEIARDVVPFFDKQIVAMRFTSDMAREYAISQLPR